jgi:hypothetical protein
LDHQLAKQLKEEFEHGFNGRAVSARQAESVKAFSAARTCLATPASNELASIRSVQVLNGIVLRRGIPPVAAALLVPLLMIQPSQAAPVKSPRAAFTQAPALGRAGAAGSEPASTASVAGDATCAKARKKLWTESGWIVRRVTLCR